MYGSFLPSSDLTSSVFNQLIANLAIPSDLFANLNLFEQFTAASYCPGNNDVAAGGPKLTCSAGNCPLVDSSDVITTYEFEK